MPKKYLLYIHDHERFDSLSERGQKSNLINELLDKHWKGLESPEKLKKAIQRNPGTPKIIAKPDEVKPALEAIGAEVQTCPHGFAVGMCKKSSCNKNLITLNS